VLETPLTRSKNQDYYHLFFLSLRSTFEEVPPTVDSDLNDESVTVYVTNSMELSPY
jgi:hypothetical protein